MYTVKLELKYTRIGEKFKSGERKRKIKRKSVRKQVPGDPWQSLERKVEKWEGDGLYRREKWGKERGGVSIDSQKII